MLTLFVSKTVFRSFRIAWLFGPGISVFTSGLVGSLGKKGAFELAVAIHRPVVVVDTFGAKHLRRGRARSAACRGATNDILRARERLD